MKRAKNPNLLKGGWSMEKYDVVIFGVGSGGCAAALRAADLGKSVLIVEQRREDGLGGTCINRGCIPTKALLRSANMYWQMKQARTYGLLADNIFFDLKQVMGKKNSIVKKLAFGLNYILKARGVKIKTGRPSLLDNHNIEIQGEKDKKQIYAENIIIATGSEPAEIPAFNIDRNNVITSDECLNLEKIPDDILIIGAGAMGIEFSMLLSSFGAKVTMVEMADNVVPQLKDVKLTKLIQELFEKRGIKIKTGVKIEGIEIRDEGKVSAMLSSKEVIETQKVLVTIGRKLNSDSLGLEKIGVKTEGSRILTDSQMMTNVPNIFAAGDITGGLLLSHKAQREGIIAAENICNIGSKMDYNVVPWAIFSWPEIASVGLTVDEAVEKGLDVSFGELPFTANEKANTMQETQGIVKIVAENDTKRIIGAQIIGPEASVIIAELALAIKQELTLEQIADTIHLHPSLTEAVMEACKSALGRAYSK
jgi:dihydrolipoamide dehydrogenase